MSLVFQAALLLLPEAWSRLPGSCCPKALQDTLLSLRQDQLYLLDSETFVCSLLEASNYGDSVILLGNLIPKITTTRKFPQQQLNHSCTHGRI